MNYVMEVGTADDTLQLESNVRSYSRTFKETFDTASGSWIYTKDGGKYLDFLAGCGSLNYGHNHPTLKQALVDYIVKDGMSMCLDMQSIARSNFIRSFNSIILKPRGMDHRIHFTGPTGANSVEAAIKLARKVTGRTNVVAFTNGFHGCSLGALALTGSSHHRASSATLLNQVTRMPYDGYLGRDIDTAEVLDVMMKDPSGGIDPPAAIIIELVQGEGGLQTASVEWVSKIARIAKDHGALLIVDDIQAGCGRTGSFFSFDKFGIEPDLICMAKAISGYGLPMSVLLMKPELDQWLPGEHNGTFRGNTHAFITAATALEIFWENAGFESNLSFLCADMLRKCISLSDTYGLKVKGRGAMMGLEFSDPEQAARVQSTCVSSGLILERCGPLDQVLKFLPPLNVSSDDLDLGFSIIDKALEKSSDFQETAVAISEGVLEAS
ncbi:hypothetical protein P775_12585 [Puniceibacterium antarcticum]|uniref:Diaminobutyrate--2-oxoglutarate transaminase n=1 Tax=Puniceibacterium antarcticum TaxID=1206336 RepID=A0A2G8RE18_9RHOB|nr:diaminobutyrate--2-oxoglutarate transaminase [Puniceibacterium antarcticum]PIL19836.1 hypothetical protein P775_12585 [Puniceibacterium antarcticum]